MRRSAALIAAVAGCVALSGCAEPTPEEIAAALPTIQESVLTACVTPTPRLVMSQPSAPGGFEGFDIDVLTAVADELNLQLELVEVSFDALVSGVALNSMVCDLGAGGIVATDDPVALVTFSTSYRDVDHLLLAPASAAIVATTPDALSAVVVGVESGAPAELVADQLPQATIERYPSQADLLRAFGSGAVQAVLVAPEAAASVRAEIADAEVVLRLATGERNVLVLPQGANLELLDGVNAALTALRESAEYGELMDRWLTG